VKNKKLTIATVVILIIFTVALISLELYSPGKEYIGVGSVLRAATTTSLYATGLLDSLAEEFQRRNPGFSVQFIAVGSGEALRRASLGDADIVLVHAPPLEKRYLDEGYLVEGFVFAYNYFTLVGPEHDPAEVEGKHPVEAFRSIFRAGEEGLAVFVSRGDNSGTHVRELMLWSLAGLNPEGRGWYLETGSGMASTLRVADERLAYTLTDIGTWLKLKNRLPQLRILLGEDKLLINIYSVYLVNPSKVEGVNEEMARRFIDFIKSEEGQGVISSFEPMFMPALSKDIRWLEETWSWLAGY